jgi:hypothetical protein
LGATLTPLNGAEPIAASPQPLILGQAILLGM